MDQIKIKFYENALEPNLCRELYNDSVARLKNGNALWRTNYWWHESIIKESCPVLVHNYDEQTSNTILESLIHNGVISDKNYMVMNYVWTKGSYIPWHGDGHVAEGITVYLNEYWDDNWGGFFLYRENDKDTHLKGIVPKFNLASKNFGNVEHTVTTVNPAAQNRITIQMFRKS
jgi:hypothetical protein